MATKTKKRKEEEELKQVFPAQVSFDVFIEAVKEAAEGTGATDEGIEEMVRLLTDKYGQNLPEEHQWYG